VAEHVGRQARSHLGITAGSQAGKDGVQGYGKSNKKRCRKTDAPMHILTGGTIYAQSYKMDGHTGGQYEIAGTGRKIDRLMARPIFTHTVYAYSIAHIRFVLRFLGVLRGGIVLRELSKYP